MARVKKTKAANLITVGWREWVGLPDLGVAHLKAKVDTGARTSALHAFDMKTFTREGLEYVRFVIHPFQGKMEPSIQAEAPVAEWRKVKSSNGKSELRPIIETTVELQDKRWRIELTLTRRDEMSFRMLLGREALRRHCLVNPGKSYLGGKQPSPSKGDAMKSGNS